MERQDVNNLDDIEECCRNLLLANPDVRGAAVIGSRARQSSFPADQYSDLDLVVICNDPDAFLAQVDWVEAIGQPLLSFIQKSALSTFQERRVLFDSGNVIDVVAVPFQEIVESSASGDLIDKRDVLRRGFRILFDRGGIEERFQWLEGLAFATPDLFEEYENTLHSYLFHAIWAARKLARGELWMALSCVNSVMATALLQMIEWSSRRQHGDQYDTWHRGRFLERWADPSIIGRLPTVFATYEHDSVAQAIHDSLELFRSLAQMTFSEHVWDENLFNNVAAKVKLIIGDSR